MAVGMDVEGFVRRVGEAFPDPGCPDELHTPCTCEECQDLVAFLKERPFWRPWSASDCFAAHTVALMGDAFRYYLPAYMVATVVDAEEADVAVDSAMWSFLNWRKPANVNHGLFLSYDFLQRTLILEWLRYCVDTWNSEDYMGGPSYRRQIGELEQLHLSKGRG